MRKFQAALIAFIASTALATTAHAQALDGDTQVYGSVGYQNGDYGHLGSGLGAIDFSGRFTATRFFSIEGDFGVGTGSKTTDFLGTTASTKLENNLGIYGVGTYPVLKNVELFARLGFTSARFTATNPGFEEKQSVSGATLGVGARYFPGGGKNGIELSYNRIDLRYNGEGSVGQLSYVRRF
jgi:hypothetical protein